MAYLNDECHMCRGLCKCIIFTCLLSVFMFIVMIVIVSLFILYLGGCFVFLIFYYTFI